MNQELQNRYLGQQPTPYPNGPYSQPHNPGYPQEPIDKSGASFFTILFWGFVMAGLLLAAFYYGYFAPVLHRLRAKIAELSKPTEPATLRYEVIGETDTPKEEKPQEEVKDGLSTAPMTIDDQFAEVNRNAGILDDSLMDGAKTGKALLDKYTQQEDQN